MTFLETKNWKLETSSGSYLSTNLLLVSDEEDRVGLGLPPDARLAMSNRTFKVSLGDETHGAQETWLQTWVVESWEGR